MLVKTEKVPTVDDNITRTRSDDDMAMINVLVLEFGLHFTTIHPYDDMRLS